jgi:hypothetical protein
VWFALSGRRSITRRLKKPILTQPIDEIIALLAPRETRRPKE